MADYQTQQSSQPDFNSIYARRRRASLDDARFEAEAIVEAIKRIGSSVDEKSSGANQNFAAGQLYEIANELPSAEAAYRRALAADPEFYDAIVRLVIVLTKQRRFDEAIEIGNDMFLKEPTGVYKSLVYQGVCSLCTIMGDAYRLAGDFAVAAGFYREAAKLKGGPPYSVSQAVVTMALSGDEKNIPGFAGRYPGANLSERVSSIVRLSAQTEGHFPIIRQVAARANIAASEMAA